MIDNDSRTCRHGIKLGDRVEFRWNSTSYQGEVIRLTVSKAVIRIGENDSRTVSYRQIRQSDRYAER